jgi:hypothetical protein
MTLTVWIDGWPYAVAFTGTVDIARTDTNDVAVRRVSDDAVVSLSVDQAALDDNREKLSAVRHVEETYRNALRQ